MPSETTEHLFWIPSAFEEIDRLAERAGELSAEAGLDGDAADSLQLCLSETLNNVVEHGHSGDGSQQIEIRLTVDRQGFEVTVADSGQPIDESVFSPPRVDRSAAPGEVADRGYGWSVIEGCVDRIEYRRSGQMNVLSLGRGSRV